MHEFELIIITLHYFSHKQTDSLSNFHTYPIYKKKNQLHTHKIFSLDLGPSNRGLATKLGISAEQNIAFSPEQISEAKTERNLVYGFDSLLAPTDHKHPVFWIFDFVHLFKTIRAHFLDEEVVLPCGCKVSVADFYDLLDKVRAQTSDHTTGFHINEDHLEVQSQDRQDVRMAMQLLSERTAAALTKYFPNEPNKQALAKFVLCCANAFKVATSRIKEDRKDHLHSALGWKYFDVIFHTPNFANDLCLNVCIKG